MNKRLAICATALTAIAAIGVVKCTQNKRGLSPPIRMVHAPSLQGEGTSTEN